MDRRGQAPMRVWIDYWQMDCCGDPFRVGDRIQWEGYVTPNGFRDDVLGPLLASTVTHAQEHHESDHPGSVALTGTVTGIKAVYCKWVPSAENQRIRVVAPGSGRIFEWEEAEAFQQPIDGLDWNGYLVDVDPSEPR
jgi:hypothetical protein